MRCEYNDGLKVDYSGSLQITQGKDVNIYMKEGAIPADVKNDLERAATAFSCDDFRSIAQNVRNSVGDRACIH